MQNDQLPKRLTLTSFQGPVVLQLHGTAHRDVANQKSHDTSACDKTRVCTNGSISWPHKVAERSLQSSHYAHICSPRSDTRRVFGSLLLDYKMPNTSRCPKIVSHHQRPATRQSHAHCTGRTTIDS